MAAATTVAADPVRFRYTSPAPGSPFRAGHVRNGRPTQGDGRAARLSADRLAIYFGLVGLTRDVHPVSPWVGSESPRPAPPRPAGTSDVAEFTQRFRDAVARAMGDHEVVAVSMSGGMDSLALVDTVARQCRHSGRRLVVVTLDVTDDVGRRTIAQVARQLEFLGVDAVVDAVVARPSRWPDPPWNPVGPRFDAWPRLHVGVALTAAERGAGVLLQGTGADQLLQVTPYLEPELVRRRRWNTLAVYRRDNPSGAIVNTLLAGSGRLGSKARARLYWATAWPGFTTDRGAPLLTGERSRTLERWLADFERESVRAVVEARASWAEATMMNRLFPYDILDEVGPVAERMPFLDPEFAAYAYDLPLVDRFEPALDNAYLRGKALVASLLPDGVDAVLAPRRQRFYAAYRRYWQCVEREPRHAVELGLVRPDWRRHLRDAFDAAMLTNCEEWLEGAVKDGAEPVSADA